MTEVTTNAGEEESGNSTSEDTFVSESSTPVHWTQTSPTQTSPTQSHVNRTNQTDNQTNPDTHDDMEFTTSSGLSETASTSETPANKAGAIFCLKSSWEF